ncbi:DNA/RNA nuclease SfsA [Picrophilus oshimae]|uniref:Sugar fermentation stimulation protein homolog n=1 Tax=Picrophilus torridus (strain ATCC 700027 / DSM 9790 / JCM 10055 / NBRC 100828 / KAW 2/3) TaxID=1122961 RepID=SFSA_PICTO|nr:DNA/RNA nuclease SfsA [Picrophilus oshimae]Q6KZZ4.1 RecName: Full=Sugar fermentation stimulation protein homolog [Picrophilus oshimae DSM 9789]AAT43708.1 sugar fermentation stimulation protein [Picrophilus oshimae DSM 9789]
MSPFIKRGHGFMVLSFENLIDAVIVSRINRFVVKCMVNNEEVYAHLHDPGRLNEIIYPGNKIKLRKTDGKKYNYSVTFGHDGFNYTLNDARFHSMIASQFLRLGFKKEYKYMDSRIDFLLDEYLIEVKSCTLVNSKKAMFPDAVTRRGTHHLNVLLNSIQDGYRPYIMFLIFNERAECFTPNKCRDPEFSGTFYRAVKNGVSSKFLVFYIRENSIYFDKEISMCVD